MSKDSWPTKSRAVASLHLDSRNPRLGRETSQWAPREIVQHLFQHDKAMEVAESIAARGYFPNEPLLAVKEGDHLVVVEGNRRLAALKALREPGLLDGSTRRRLEKLVKRMSDPRLIATVPVTIAPSRRATDRQVAGRHLGSPVLAWQAENRASFILSKLEEGYSNVELGTDLGFSLADIQKARQTRAIAEMARSIDLPEEVKAKLEKPRAKVYTTLERVFESTVGREYLRVEPDADHGLRGTTSKAEFIRGFSRLVEDVVLGRQSSRTLNTGDNIRSYFESLPNGVLPLPKRGSFVPADIIQGRSVASPPTRPHPKRSKKTVVGSETVVPKSLKVLYGNDRLVDIRRELTRLKRSAFPNAGAVLLRVFLEVAIVDYLSRAGLLESLVERLEGKTGHSLRFGVPTMQQLAPEITKVAKARLPKPEANKVEKALKYDPAAPFSLSDLHAFVHHSSDPPSERDIWQFWIRTEPLFRLMLEEAPGAPAK